MSKPFSDFRLEVFGNDFKNCNYLSIATSSWRTFPLKKVFFPHSSSVFKLNFSVFLAKILQQIYHRCILYVPRNNWWNTTFWKKRYYSMTTDFQRFAFEIWQEASTDLPKLHIICKTIFWGKTFFSNKRLITDFFSDCEWKVSAGVFKNFPTFSEEVFYRKNISFQNIMSFPG